MSPRYENIWTGVGPAAVVTRTLLAPASFAYGLGARARAALYDRGLLAIERAPLPVVSIGNLRVGGSGKTPLALWLGERLVAAGKRPAVLTRGYGATASSLPVVVAREGGRRLERASSRESHRLVTVRDARTLPAGLADEASLIALRGDFPVVVSPDRVRGGRVAAELDCDVAILDDGFQHRRLGRDFDIVLTSADDATARMLPSGPLREPLAALARADLVVTMDDAAPTAARPSFRAHQVARGLVSRLAPGEQPRPMTTLRGREVVAVAGIARPERFLDLLARSGASLTHDAKIFRDHHAYDADDAAALLRAAGSRAAIVTTEKDLVKLARLLPADAPLEAVRIDLELENTNETDAADALVGRVLDAIERHSGLKAASGFDAPASELHHRQLTPNGTSGEV